jgi:hypothetical protein
MGFKSAVIGGVTAGLTFEVGELGGVVDKGAGHGTSLSNVAIKAPLHGLIQGGAAEAQGGSFRSGFLSGSFTSFATLGTGQIQGNGWKIVSSAIVGGTASEIGGGKFSNGAISGATVEMYNDLAGNIREAQSNRDPMKRLVADAQVSWELAGYADGTAGVDKLAELWLNQTGDYAGYVTIKAQGMLLTGATLPVKVAISMIINPVVILYNEMEFNDLYRDKPPIMVPSNK